MMEYFFESRGIYYRMNTFQEGRPTVVFVHGLSGSSSAWLPYEKELESTCNILSLDLRGHGKSEKPKFYEEYKIEKFADDLNLLTEHLKINKFILIGHSLGAFIVLAFLQKHQEKVSKVVFLAPHFSVGKMFGAKMTIPFLWLFTSVFKKIPFSGRAGKHVDYSRYPNSGDRNIPRIIADVRNTTTRVYLYAIRQSHDFDGEEFLKKIHIPTLIIHGRNDTILPVKYGALMAEKIPGARLVILEDADHILALNKVKEILDEVRSFMLD